MLPDSGILPDTGIRKNVRVYPTLMGLFYVNAIKWLPIGVENMLNANMNNPSLYNIYSK